MIEAPAAGTAVSFATTSELCPQSIGANIGLGVQRAPTFASWHGLQAARSLTGFALGPLSLLGGDKLRDMVRWRTRGLVPQFREGCLWRGSYPCGMRLAMQLGAGTKPSRTWLHTRSTLLGGVIGGEDEQKVGGV